jgi:hypothetical protein
MYIASSLNRVNLSVRKVAAEIMFSKCVNSDCATSFDYRQGRYFRFHQRHPAGAQPRNAHSVQHFWLCKQCAETHRLEYRKGCGLLISRRFKGSHEEHVPRLIMAD